jgi:hypothetical protein
LKPYGVRPDPLPIEIERGRRLSWHAFPAHEASGACSLRDGFVGDAAACDEGVQALAEDTRALDPGASATDILGKAAIGSDDGQQVRSGRALDDPKNAGVGIGARHGVVNADAVDALTVEHAVSWRTIEDDVDRLGGQTRRR